MFTVVQEQRIVAPIEEVFGFLAHFENRPRFESAVVEAVLTTEGEVAVGSRYREVRKVMGFRTVTVHEITEYQPPSRLSFSSVSGMIPLEGVYDLSESAGGTDVEFRMSMSPRGVMGWFSSMIRGQTKRDLARYYTRLKQVLEDSVD